MIWITLAFLLGALTGAGVVWYTRNQREKKIVEEFAKDIQRITSDAQVVLFAAGDE